MTKTLQGDAKGTHIIANSRMHVAPLIAVSKSTRGSMQEGRVTERPKKIDSDSETGRQTVTERPRGRQRDKPREMESDREI